MSEYWKSTPSYWCKFCSSYVRDTPIERKNHEATAKHQNNIQRSLRDLHKNQERQQREQQRAKDEVARLNGLVEGSKGSSTGNSSTGASKPVSSTPAFAPPKLSAAAQRKAHAEQLAALGVALPEDLKREVTGVGGWQVVSERVIEDGFSDVKHEDASGQADSKDGIIKGVHKRKVEDEDEALASSKRKAWGSSLKTYPGHNAAESGDDDLNILLSGVTKKKEPEVAEEKKNDSQGEEESSTEDAPVKKETGISTILEPLRDDSEPVKREFNDTAITAPPIIAFKKRKGKK